MGICIWTRCSSFCFERKNIIKFQLRTRQPARKKTLPLECFLLASCLTSNSPGDSKLLPAILTKENSDNGYCSCNERNFLSGSKN